MGNRKRLEGPKPTVLASKKLVEVTDSVVIASKHLFGSDKKRRST